ncbi:MAG: ubiquinone/menaquinone biosynthesis methyltransferase [Verrucomicrobiota bacterium]|nr:ubiquinone/menaquinone biosynthesis methyltransferase [Verrucomicrobiota bacterium]
MTQKLAFDPISPTYDRINRILSFGQDLSWRRFVAKQLPTNIPLTLLDLAAGTLDQLIACMESPAQIQSATAIDLSPRMLEVGRAKIADKPYKDRICCLTSDLHQLPFQDNSFDAITLSFGIRNAADPKRALTEIARLLKPKGRVLILEFSLAPYPWRPFHLFYLRYLLPSIGNLFSHNREAYLYLSKTILSFPYGAAFCSLLQESGLTSLRTFSLALGAVTLYVAEKS